MPTLSYLLLPTYCSSNDQKESNFRKFMLQKFLEITQPKPYLKVQTSDGYRKSEKKANLIVWQFTFPKTSGSNLDSGSDFFIFILCFIFINSFLHGKYPYGPKYKHLVSAS